MTSDAKIGLLLGLVFIFVIAFIINGLPSLRSNENNNELTTKMVGFGNEPPGLGAKERKAQETISRIEPRSRQSFNEEPSTRFEMPLPNSTPIAKEATTKKTADDIMPIAQAVITDIQSSSANSTRTKTYTVTNGDNLAVIAKKFYGDEEGNRIQNITRIFEANRKQLKSPGEIYVGQKLVIPPLPSAGDSKKINGVFPRQDFEEADSTGRRNISTTPTKTVKTKQSRIYIVQEDDSLWQIAAEQLGNGSRYTEIRKLNADILDDEDTITVGMRLKLPAQ